MYNVIVIVNRATAAAAVAPPVSTRVTLLRSSCVRVCMCITYSCVFAMFFLLNYCMPIKENNLTVIKIRSVHRARLCVRFNVSEPECNIINFFFIFPTATAVVLIFETNHGE